MNIPAPPSLPTYPRVPTTAGALGLSNIRPPITGIPPTNSSLNTSSNPGIPEYNTLKPSALNSNNSTISTIGNIPHSLPPSNLTSTKGITSPTTIQTNSEQGSISEVSSKSKENNKIETLNSNTITTTIIKENSPLNDKNKLKNTETVINTNNATNPLNVSISRNNGNNATVQFISSNKVSEFILVYSDNDVSVVSFNIYILYKILNEYLIKYYNNNNYSNNNNFQYY